MQFTFERRYITVLFKVRFNADTKWHYQEWHNKEGMLFTILIESFKFEDEDEKEDEINFKFFSRTLKNIYPGIFLEHLFY